MRKLRTMQRYTRFPSRKNSFWNTILLILAAFLDVVCHVHAPMHVAQCAVLCICETLLWVSFLKRNHVPLGGITGFHRSLVPLMMLIGWKDLFDAFYRLWKFLHTLWYQHPAEFVLVLPVSFNSLKNVTCKVCVVKWLPLSGEVCGTAGVIQAGQ